MDLDPVRLKVLKLVKDRKPPTDMKGASIAMGRNAAYLHQFVYRGTPKVLSEDDREALAEHLGCKAEELKHKKVPPRKPRKKAAPKEGRIEPSTVATAPEGYMAIPEIDVRASAGPGALNEGLEETKEMWFFPDLVIRHEFRARPADLRMITIDGDSMEPLLASGDRILIDTSQRVPVPPGIFVIWDGMGLVAKRIEHEPNSEPPKVVIKSVNPEYDTYERDAEEVHIIGRVVWTSRRL
jgi:phage repressor protein C with HTH and peptisase S24 domain|tara:strand:- start:219 stop:935 length:717 start_codon:yes stop_codon:yes gene_type:complete